jgi:hypothetical protein
MAKLEFLEVNKNFKSYYKTLRDVNYYLGDSKLGKENIKATTKVITKLIFDFIRTSGTTFRDMDEEKYIKAYEMFHEDFLRIIENSGVNNVEFDEFAGLLDELIQIANHRTAALQKIKTTKQEMKVSHEDGESLENDTPEENNHLQITQMVIEKRPQLIIETSAIEETVSELEEEVEEDIENKNEAFEGDDVYHYRPKKRRFR